MCYKNMFTILFTFEKVTKLPYFLCMLNLQGERLNQAAFRRSADQRVYTSGQAHSN